MSPFVCSVTFGRLKKCAWCALCKLFFGFSVWLSKKKRNQRTTHEIKKTERVQFVSTQLDISIKFEGWLSRNKTGQEGRRKTSREASNIIGRMCCRDGAYGYLLAQRYSFTALSVCAFHSWRAPARILCLNKIKSERKKALRGEWMKWMITIAPNVE